MARDCAGATVGAVGALLGISPNTVKHHLRAVYDTLDVGSRVELVAALGTAP